MRLFKSPLSISLTILWVCGLIWSAGNLALGSPQDMAALAGSGSTPDCDPDNCHNVYWGVSMCTGTPPPGELCPTDQCTTVTNYYAYCDYKKDGGKCDTGPDDYLKGSTWTLYDMPYGCQSSPCGRERYCGCPEDPERNCIAEVPCCTLGGGYGCPGGTFVEEGESEDARIVCK